MSRKERLDQDGSLWASILAKMSLKPRLDQTQNEGRSPFHSYHGSTARRQSIKANIKALKDFYRSSNNQRSSKVFLHTTYASNGLLHNSSPKAHLLFKNNLHAFTKGRIFRPRTTQRYSQPGVQVPLFHQQEHLLQRLVCSAYRVSPIPSQLESAISTPLHRTLTASQSLLSATYPILLPQPHKRHLPRSTPPIHYSRRLSRSEHFGTKAGELA